MLGEVRTVQLLPDFVSSPWLISMRTQVRGDPNEWRVLSCPLYTCLEMNVPIAVGIRSRDNVMESNMLSGDRGRAYTAYQGTPRPFADVAVRIC